MLHKHSWITTIRPIKETKQRSCIPRLGPYMERSCNCPAHFLINNKCPYGNKCRTTCVVYKVDCKTTGKFYIDNTQQSVKKRTVNPFRNKFFCITITTKSILINLINKFYMTVGGLLVTVGLWAIFETNSLTVCYFFSLAVDTSTNGWDKWMGQIDWTNRFNKSIGLIDGTNRWDKSIRQIDGTKLSILIPGPRGVSGLNYDRTIFFWLVHKKIK